MLPNKHGFTGFNVPEALAGCSSLGRCAVAKLINLTIALTLAGITAADRNTAPGGL